MRYILAAALALLPLPAWAQSANAIVAPILAEAGPGTRWGMVVADDSGREIVAINPEGRFMPASNTKLYTTAAAMWAEAKGTGPRLGDSGTAVWLVEGDVLLVGRGDARLSARPDCMIACLATLADAVAAKTRRVRHVIGDASLFLDERWSPGMSWNNIPTGSGTAIAALGIDENEIAAAVAPGALGEPPSVAVSSYFKVVNRAETVPGEQNTLAYDRSPNSRVLEVSGKLGLAHAPVTWGLGVDDPAHYAAWTFADMLKKRGVKITGGTRSRYCDYPTVPSAGGGLACTLITMHAPPVEIARHEGSSLPDEVAAINKPSQNFRAEVLLRRLGLSDDLGSIEKGEAVVSAMLAEAGVAPAAASLSDGSGMSSYNRVAPRGTLRLLQFAAQQPWGETLRASLPIGGVDGTLRRRFVGTMLAGKVQAKTGTLNATNALAGWLTAASGKVLTFAIYANDVPDGVRATAIMDRALLALAAAN